MIRYFSILPVVFLFPPGLAAGQSPSNAQLTSLEEFDGLSTDGQFSLIQSALARIYNVLVIQGGDVEAGECMSDLFLEAPDGNNDPEGYTLFLNTLNILRVSDDEEKPSVERVIYNIVQTRCVAAATSDRLETPD